jgi:hypothetical protein
LVISGQTPPQQINDVICYDIVEDRKRNRASETLKDYGIRVQRKACLNAGWMLSRLTRSSSMAGLKKNYKNVQLHLNSKHRK